MAALAAGLAVGALGVAGAYPMHFASFAAMLSGADRLHPLAIPDQGSQYGSTTQAADADDTADINRTEVAEALGETETVTVQKD